MRIYVACLMLLVAPAAITYWYLEHFRPGLDAPPQLATRGEVLFFNATWCGPCRQMKPVVQQLRQQGYRMRSVDVDKQRSLAAEYGIRAVPTFVFVEDGREVNRISGGTSADHLRQLCAGPAYR